MVAGCYLQGVNLTLQLLWPVQPTTLLRTYLLMYMLRKEICSCICAYSSIPYKFLWAEVLWWIFSKVNLFPDSFQNTSELTGVQFLLKDHSLSDKRQEEQCCLDQVKLRKNNVYLVILPEACNIFLIVVHIWPASKLLDDFWFTLEGLWKLLNHRDIVFKCFNEVIHIKNIRENAAHAKHKLWVKKMVETRSIICHRTVSQK